MRFQQNIQGLVHAVELRKYFELRYFKSPLQATAFVSNEIRSLLFHCFEFEFLCKSCKNCMKTMANFFYHFTQPVVSISGKGCLTASDSSSVVIIMLIIISCFFVFYSITFFKADSIISRVTKTPIKPSIFALHCLQRKKKNVFFFCPFNFNFEYRHNCENIPFKIADNLSMEPANHVCFLERLSVF